MEKTVKVIEISEERNLLIVNDELPNVALDLACELTNLSIEDLRLKINQEITIVTNATDEIVDMVFKEE